jgi:hypothetical protein
MAKECRITPASSVSKQRLRQLQVLASEGDPRAKALAAQVQGVRHQQAGALREERQVNTLRRMLQDPKVAAMVRSGRISLHPAETANKSDPTPSGKAKSLAGMVSEVAPGQIEVDPQRFQYKIVSNAAGEVGSLRDVRKWDDNLAGVISVWQDPADGKTYVVNGHNRLGLAKRQGVKSVTVRYLRAANAKDARAIGALQNIAEGQGTEVDAAKFFRDSGIRTKADVEARGLPLSSGKAGRGLALARLPREMFDRVVQGDLSVGRGAIIGGSGLDASKQREIGKLLKVRPSISDGTLGEYVEALAASQRQKQQTLNLFGNSTEEVETGLARAELVNGITRKIGKERRLFSMVSGSRAAATLQEKAGNQINREASGEVASAADRLGRMFKDMKNVSGPMSMAINRAASRVTAGEKREKVQRDLYEDVVKAMEAELERAGLAPKVPSKEAETTNLFDSAAAPAGMALLSILEDRMDALRRKCTTGYGCGSACISVQKECRARPASAMGRERIQRLQQLARGEIKPQGLGVPAPGDAAAMAEDLQGRRAARAAGLSEQRMARQAPSPAIAAGATGLEDLERRALDLRVKAEDLAMGSTGNQEFAAGAGKPAIPEVLPPGPMPSKTTPGLETLAIVRQVMGNKKLRSDRQRIAEMIRLGIPADSDFVKLAAQSKVAGRPNDQQPVELTSPGRAAQPKPAANAGLNASDVVTATQQAQFARQQLEAAKAAGDEAGAKAWRKEEAAVQRARVRAAARRAQQNQASLFGVTEYDETMPLFKRRDGVLAEAQIDALRRRCSIGYGCGSACISLQKECRVTPLSAVTQRRLKRLMSLAAGGASGGQERKSPTERKIAALNTVRDQLGKNLVASLSRQRPDGSGNFIEHPDAAAMQQIKSAKLRVAKLDRQLNVLEGKDPDEKRWIEGDPYGLARYSDFQSPGRKAYERKVIAMELKGATVGDQAVFMSGGPASGKTSLLKRQFGDAKGFAVIDPDRIKGYDPVMEIGVAMGMRRSAELAHENSSRLSRKVYATARDRGLNVLMDGTGANVDKYIGQMQELRGKGYKITLLAQHVPEEVGVKRALRRADSTGRYVPLGFIQHAYEVIPGNFERIARVADRAILNDGESNQVIMQYQAGRFVGGNRQRTADYRKRYGKP